MKLLDYFVRFKAYATRSMFYFQIIQLLIIFILFLRPYNFPLWLQGILIIFSCGIIILVGRGDRKLKILEKEQSYMNSENKELKEIKNLLLELKNDRRN